MAQEPNTISEESIRNQRPDLRKTDDGKPTNAQVAEQAQTETEEKAYAETASNPDDAENAAKVEQDRKAAGTADAKQAAKTVASKRK